MKKTRKILDWIITSVLALVFGGLAFVYFVPGYSFSIVKSGSMAPVFNAGDVIITGPAGERLAPGMILMFRQGEDTITHRLLSINGQNLVTKGDAVEDADPWPVAVPDVRGVYLFKIPVIGYLLNFVKTKTGWFLSIIVPAAALIGWLCWDILKEAFKDEKHPVKTGTLKHNIKQEPRKNTQTTSIRAESNARLREYLIQALNNTQKTQRDSAANANSAK